MHTLYVLDLWYGVHINIAELQLDVVLVHAHLTSSLTFSYCFLIYPHESGTRHLPVLCKGPRQLLPAAYSVAQHYINSLVHPECIIFLYFTTHIARFN